MTIAGLYSYLDECFGPWDQRPAFKANVDRLNELRRCAPAVPPSELREIRELFPAADHVFPLDPSYEPDAEPRDPTHERAFGTLQRYRAAKLLVPVGAEHMYFAAMESKACRLTPLGTTLLAACQGRQVVTALVVTSAFAGPRTDGRRSR